MAIATYSPLPGRGAEGHSFPERISMGQAPDRPRRGTRVALTAFVASLAIMPALAVRASAAADPSLCTVVTQSGSPSSEVVEGVSTAYSPDGSQLYTLGHAYPGGSRRRRTRGPGT